MTDEKSILEAAEAHFENLANRPDTVWPNQSHSAAVPRLEFTQGPITPGKVAPDGSALTAFIVQATVVTASGSRSATLRGLGAQVAGHFKAGTKISDAIVTERPQMAAPYLDDDEWRLPITITLRARLAA